MDENLNSIDCKICGAKITVNPGESVCTCSECQSQQGIPKLGSEHINNLHSRGNNYRLSYEFDRARAVYELIEEEQKDDADVFWSLFLCHYGIEYVADRKNKKYIPTMNRAQYVSVYEDPDYVKAISLATPMQRSVYEAEAKVLAEIQNNILEVSKTEEPFDVFICYKENDENGRRTNDSLIANEVYQQLVREDVKTFFARVTLEDKLGSEYEPYIFAALNSAKVMLVMGSKPEFFDAVWVKNEWGRFLSLMGNDEKRTLIPMYKNMDAYDLPKELQQLQALDMNKLGFLQDLIRSVREILTDENKVLEIKEKKQTKIDYYKNAFLIRAQVLLKKKEYNEAARLYDQILGVDPKCYEAYLGKMLLKWKANDLEELKDILCRKMTENDEEDKKIKMKLGADFGKYVVPGYLEYNDILEQICADDFSELSMDGSMLANVNYVSESLNTLPFRAARLFAEGEHKEELDTFYNQMSNLIDEATKREMSKRKVTLEDAYDNLKSEREPRIKEVYQKAIDLRQKDYEECVRKFSDMGKLKDETKEVLINKLNAMGHYTPAISLLRDIGEGRY